MTPLTETLYLCQTAALPDLFGGVTGWVLLAVGIAVLLVLSKWSLGVRWIPNDQVGVVEKLWSSTGSLRAGQIIALGGEAGYQADVLRGGLHFFLWPWQYRIHRVPLTHIPQGEIGYVFARDGEPLKPAQTLARVVECDDFQDARSFILGGTSGDEPTGQSGRQRAILREGVYAINVALFVVITERHVYRLEGRNASTKRDAFAEWQHQLREMDGFHPVVIGGACSSDWEPVEEGHEPPALDEIAIVTTHDGPALEPGQLIAPPVAVSPEDPHYHNNYQDVEAFLRAGGRRGRQFVPLTDGTYFINRWFATVELKPKTVVPIGSVGVVVSYFGGEGQDRSGEGFRHGERVGTGERGVQARTLNPGKYPFNTYAGRIHLVPTTNFVLHWITGRSETHRYDESLKSIDLVTADAYEPVLPLSVVVHIDYEKAPSVVQRFGDVKRLITQTLDPLLSAYFRDIAHRKTMLELLHSRDVIQQEARDELRSRFAHFDIELVDVLIGKPSTDQKNGKIENLLEQLRLRQLAREQVETFEEQKTAAEKLRTLKTAQAHAEKQTELTNSEVEIEIARNRGGAELARARLQAEQTVVTAEADNKKRRLLAEAESRRTVLLAEAEGKAKALLGEGESRRVHLEGEAEAHVLERKVASYRDPRLYALSNLARAMSRSRQPLVPERVFIGERKGREPGSSPAGMLGTLLDLLVGERLGLDLSAPPVEKGKGASANGDAAPPATVARDSEGADPDAPRHGS